MDRTCGVLPETLRLGNDTALRAKDVLAVDLSDMTQSNRRSCQACMLLDGLRVDQKL